MANAVLIAVVGHGSSKPPAYAELALRLAEQEQAGVGRLVAAEEIDCELLAADGWLSLPLSSGGHRCTTPHS
jgi:hypothetical protein